MAYLYVKKVKVALINPVTNQPLKAENKEQVMTTKDIILRVLNDNPMWAESYANIKAAVAIEKDLKDCENLPYFKFTDTDGKKLKEAVLNPKSITEGGVVNGFALLPVITRQIHPILREFDLATDEWKEPVEELPAN